MKPDRSRPHGALEPRLGVAPRRRAARTRPDPPLLRVRERRPAHQRAPGVPRRLGARPGRHRHALPQPPGPARGPAGQAARRGGQHARARRRGPLAGPRRRIRGSGRGEEGTGGRDKASILADTARSASSAPSTSTAAWTRRADALVHRLFDPLITRSRQARRRARLEDLAAGADRHRGLGVPEYHVEESGPDHAEVLHRGRARRWRGVRPGRGRSKKEAEQQAAEAAWTAIRERPAGPSDAPEPPERGDRLPELPEVEVGTPRPANAGWPAAPSRPCQVLHPRAVRRHAAGRRRLRRPPDRAALVWRPPGAAIPVAAARRRRRAAGPPGHERPAARRPSPAPATEKHLRVRFSLHRRRPRAALRRPAHLRPRLLDRARRTRTACREPIAHIAPDPLEPAFDDEAFLTRAAPPPTPA